MSPLQSSIYRCLEIMEMWIKSSFLVAPKLNENCHISDAAQVFGWCMAQLVQSTHRWETHATRSRNFRSLKQKLRLSWAKSSGIFFSLIDLDILGYSWMALNGLLPWPGALTKLLAFPSSSTEISSTLRQGPITAFDDRENGSIKSNLEHRSLHQRTIEFGVSDWIGSNHYSHIAMKLQAEAVYHGLVQLAGWQSCECNGHGCWSGWERIPK